jgi:hypothetical protein
MAQFNLEDYETVEERLKRFWAMPEHEDARIVTVNKTDSESRAKGVWVICAKIFLSAGDQSLNLPKATGWAFEVDGGPGANRTSALENAETSAIGRALANMNLSGNKRPSREEMSKVQNAPAVKVQKIDVDKELKKVSTKAEARALWVTASKSGVDAEGLAKIVAHGDALKD